MSFKYGQDLNNCRIDSIHEPIAAEEDFAYIVSFDLWNFSSGLRHRSCLASPFSKAGHPAPCSRRVVLGDKVSDRL